MRQGGEGQERRRGPRLLATAVGPISEAQGQEGQGRAVGVGELAGQGARESAAPDRVVLDEEEHEPGRRREEGCWKAKPQQPDRGVGRERKQDRAQRRSELERHGQAQEGGERRHQQEREGKVVEQERLPEVRAGIPAVEPEGGKQPLVEPDEGGIVARSIAPGREGGRGQERGPEVVRENEGDREQADHIALELAPSGHRHTAAESSWFVARGPCALPRGYRLG